MLSRLPWVLIRKSSRDGPAQRSEWPGLGRQRKNKFWCHGYAPARLLFAGAYPCRLFPLQPLDFSREAPRLESGIEQDHDLEKCFVVTTGRPALHKGGTDKRPQRAAGAYQWHQLFCFVFRREVRHGLRHGAWDAEGKTKFGATDTRRRGCCLPALIRAALLRFKLTIFRRIRLDLNLEWNRGTKWRILAC